MRLPAAERRQQLLSTAVRVFSARGFHDASMNDIAEAAGITKPVLYQHFTSKRDLYRELLEEIGADLRATITRATDVRTPRAQIENGFRSYFGWVVRNPEAFRLLFGETAGTDQEFAREAQRVQAMIAGVIADMIRIDALDADRRRLLAHGLAGIAESTCRYWLREGAAADPDELAEQVAELAWFGLRGIRSPG